MRMAESLPEVGEAEACSEERELRPQREKSRQKTHE